MATLIIYNTDDRDYPRIEYPYAGNRIDALEEALYIWWELTPTDRDWKHDLVGCGRTYFDYHRCEYGLVERVGEDEFRISF